MSTDPNKDARDAMLSGADKLVEWGQPNHAPDAGKMVQPVAVPQADLLATLHSQLRHLIDDLTAAADDDGLTVYVPRPGLMFSNFIGAVIPLTQQLGAMLAAAPAAPAPAPAPMVLDVRCDFCDGSGLDSRDSNYACAPCNGRGFIERKFAAPTPALVPLTDEQIDALPWGPHESNPVTFAEGLRDFARAIERAHGIGGKA